MLMLMRLIILTPRLRLLTELWLIVLVLVGCHVPPVLRKWRIGDHILFLRSCRSCQHAGRLLGLNISSWRGRDLSLSWRLVLVDLPWVPGVVNRDNTRELLADGANRRSHSWWLDSSRVEMWSSSTTDIVGATPRCGDSGHSTELRGWRMISSI